jgi:threonine/homoserine/homoserine lactone efflux protein
MSIRHVLLYFAAWSLVSLTPGPTVFCCVAQATRFGFRSSLSGIFGVQVASFLFFVCIALGLDSLLAASKIAFDTMRIIGAFYLSYFGVRLILSTFQATTLPAIQSPVAVAAKHGLFLQGLLVQLTNPNRPCFRNLSTHIVRYRCKLRF